MKGNGLVASMGKNLHVYKVLVGRLEGKGALGKPKGRWKYNTILETKATGSQDADWIHPAGCCGHDMDSSSIRYPVHKLQNNVCAQEHFLKLSGTSHTFPFVARITEFNVFHTEYTAQETQNSVMLYY